MAFKAIVTIPPYAPFIDEVIAHPIVCGVRLNTVMPVVGGTAVGALEDLLKGLKEKTGEKELWVDLKCRQLRVAQAATPPYTEILLSHDIKVDTPVVAYFPDGQGGKVAATVVKVDGNRLIMLDGPRRTLGPGESVNIPHYSLSVDGFFTDLDKRYIEAGQKTGITEYMLSFVEGPADITEFRKLCDAPRVAAKIESRKGLSYIANQYKGEARVMAARGDLFMEVKKPHHIIQAMELMIGKDPNAIAASRILDSLASGLEPSCADISDVDSLARMGYRTLMLGDEVCQQRDSVMSALNLLQAMAERYK